MPIESLTLDQAAEMTVATVRLWDVQQAIPQAKYFKFTNVEFKNWKTTNGLNDIIGEDIDQTPEGLMVYSRTWQERIPTNMRFGRKVEDAITDAGGAHGYPAGNRRTWYEHVNKVPLPADAADQDWQETIGEIIKTWEATAEYMIDKRDPC